MEKRDTPCCEEAIIHADALMQVKSLLPEDEVLYDLAERCLLYTSPSPRDNV